MARQPRFALGGQVHLVVQQGHNRTAIVRDEADRVRWLALLRDAAATHRVVLHAWGLVPETCSLLVTPPSPEALSRMMQALGRRYVGWFNARHGRSGTLWDGRYRACLVEDGAWVLAAMHFVEGLPAAEGGSSTDAPGALARSSLVHHLGQVVDPGLSDVAAYWALGNTPFERHAAYRQQAEAGLTPRQRSAIESALRGGRPLGSAQYVARLQTDAPRPLAPRRRGRPRKVPRADT